MKIEEKDEIIRCVWLHHVLFHPHAELEQLRRGIRETLQMELLCCLHPNDIRGLLASTSAYDVTSDYLCDAFAIHYSERGSNDRTKEEALIFYWYQYILECQGKHL